MVNQPVKSNNTWAIVGTIAAIVLCGCPGLSLVIFGAITASGKIPLLYVENGYIPGWIGVLSLCLSPLFIAVAVVVPLLLLRRKKTAASSQDTFSTGDPLPPAS